MKLQQPLLALLIGSLPLAGSGAELPEGMEDAMVRIFNFEQDPAGSPGAAKLVHGSCETGSGFLINDQGYAVTNEHVTKRWEPGGSVYWAAHKEKGRIILYKGTLIWDSASQDLSIIRCPELKANTLPLSLFKPGKGAAAHSLGYPGIADADLKGAQIYGPMAVFVSQNPGASKLDFTPVVTKNKTWQNMFEATYTTGTIEKESVVSGFAGPKDNNPVAVWDHTLAIRHGNSGGPFFNACGEVIGVVGRGASVKGKNDLNADMIKWSIQASELVPVLDSRNIAYTKVASPCAAVKPFFESSANKTGFPILPIVVSVVAAVGASLLVVFKTRAGRQAAVSYTRVIDAKIKELMGGRKSSFDQGDRPVASPRQASGPPAGESWMLQGKGPDGRGIRLELTASLFAENGNRLVLGRSKELCHLHVDDSSVSRQHAQIRRSEQTFYVADRNSANGTSINGRRISQPLHEEPFRENDALTFGEVRLVFLRR